jgi:rhamnosyltransferase subunit B
MARVVLTSFGSYGDVNPLIGLAIALRDRNHHPILALPAAYRGAAEAEEIEFRPVRPDVDIHDRGLAARIMHPAKGAGALFGELLIPSLDASVQDLSSAARGADLLVTHPGSLSGPIVAEELGLPWASMVLAPMSFFSVHDPVVPPPAPWMHAITSRSPVASRIFRAQTERITRRWAEPVHRFREARGLRPGGNPILEGQHSPHLVLGLFSRLLAGPQPDWPNGVVVTGAVLYNGPGANTLEPRLEEFLERGDAPLVFTLGSSAVNAAGSFYDVSAKVARRLGCRAVLLAGRHPENRPREMDDRVFLTGSAPHAALFPRAAAIIHQGGAGTLHQALRAARPMLIVPHSHDQPDNAQRARRLGVARTVSPSRYRAGRVERELRHLLADPRYGRRAADAAAVMKEEPGAQGAAQALERLVR